MGGAARVVEGAGREAQGMSGDRAEVLRELGAVVQASVVDGERAGGIVTGFVVIAEVAAPDGHMWLCGRSGTPMGDSMAVWTERGMLAQRLADIDHTVDDDEDDE